MNKNLYLFVGKSASGKTTIANMLEQDGYTQVYSYTTRPKRYENEIGHIFITDEEYDKLENIVASTLYNGYRYCTTLEQIQNADIYVIDVPGVVTLLENYDKLNRDLCVIYFEASVLNRIQRMTDRHDSDTQIISRLMNDEAEDWIEQLEDLQYETNKFTILEIDANRSVEDVYKGLKPFIHKN